MKAVVQDRYGSVDTLELREVEQAVPVADEVLVRVHAASVNAYDWTGKIAPAVERNYPLSEAAEAIRHLEVEHARAKVVVTV